MHVLMLIYAADHYQEAARYLETYKAYEQKSAESIQEKVGRTRSEHKSGPSQKNVTPLATVERATKDMLQVVGRHKRKHITGNPPPGRVTFSLCLEVRNPSLTFYVPIYSYQVYESSLMTDHSFNLLGGSRLTTTTLQNFRTALGWFGPSTNPTYSPLHPISDLSRLCVMHLPANWHCAQALGTRK